MFSYIFKGEMHSDTSIDYMQSLGMTEEAIESALNQKQYELSEKEKSERTWRDNEMSTFVDKMNHKAYWGELTEDELVTLDEYRKSLKDYPYSDSFPFGDRPVRPNLK